jgi:hypothetical protein
LKKSVILSVNDNPDYLYYAPICAWAWKQFGWDPKIFFYGKIRDLEDWALAVTKDAGEAKVIEIEEVPDFRSDTIVQTSRLHGYFFSKDDYLILGDIDMIPLSDYWKPSEEGVTVYGWDLTGFGDIPMCYVGAPSNLMRQIFSNEKQYIASEIQYDLNTYAGARSEEFDQYWYSDQRIMTRKLMEYGKDRITFIDRGQYSNGFAVGRVDRGNWNPVLSEYIDSHLMRDAYRNDDAYKKNKQLYNLIFGEKANWIEEYTAEFRHRHKEQYL